MATYQFTDADGYLALDDQGYVASSDTTGPQDIPCCCAPTGCAYRLKAVACSPGGGCGIAQSIFICPEAVCSATNQPVRPGNIISYAGHCWVIQVEGYYACPPNPDPPGRCLPFQAILVDALSFACVATCADGRCTAVDGYMLCSPCRGASGEFPTVVMRCSEVYRALNLGCACPTTCVEDTHSPPRWRACFSVNLGGQLLPAIPPGAILVSPTTCSCCECRGGSKLIDLVEGQGACPPIGAPIRECDGQSLSQVFACPMPQPTRIACCCNTRDATGTFSGEFVVHGRPPGVICDCGNVCQRVVVSNGRWDANSISWRADSYQCTGPDRPLDHLPYPYSGDFQQPTAIQNGCLFWGLSVLTGWLGNPLAGPCDIAGGERRSGLQDCYSYVLDVVSGGNQNIEWHFRMSLNPNAGTCAAGCPQRAPRPSPFPLVGLRRFL